MNKYKVSRNVQNDYGRLGSTDERLGFVLHPFHQLEGAVILEAVQFLTDLREIVGERHHHAV